MQNHPPLRLNYHPFRFDPAFPVTVESTVLSDAPITMLHWHNCLEVGQCHSGAGIFVVEDKVLPFRAGDVSVISAQEVHLAQSAGGTSSAWTFVMLDPTALVPAPAAEQDLLRTDAFSGAGFLNILTPDRHPEEVACLHAFVREVSEQAAGHRSAARALVWQLLVALHRRVGDAVEGHRSWRPSHMNAVAPALEIIAREYAQPVRIADLADACLCSLTHFRRQFAAAMGQPPQEYLTQFRVRMAMALLTHTARSIAEIAGAVGYPSLSSFNRQFLRLAGVSPRRWRQGAASTLTPLSTRTPRTS